MGVGLSEKSSGNTDGDKKGGNVKECCKGEMAGGPEKVQMNAVG